MYFYKNIFAACWLICVFTTTISAQQTPAKDQTKPILIQGATAHLGNGDIIENSMIAFDQGKFTVVNNQAVGSGFPNHTIIDATGKHVYPGFISMNSLLGLKEINAVRSTRDNRDVGHFNPSLRAIIAYNTDSKITPTIRSNGILMAQIIPQGGRISGQSSVVELDAWNWEDAAYKTDEGIHLNWPREFNFTGWWAAPGPIKKNENYKKQIKEIDEFIAIAKAYANKTKVATTNLKMEAMKGLFDQSKSLYVHTNSAKTIQEATLLAQKNNLKIVIVGGRDSWLITDFLKSNNVTVVLRTPHSLPAIEDEDIDQPFKTAAILAEAGVTFCISPDGGRDWPSNDRNLNYMAGQAVAFGLDYEEAIASISATPAKILGIYDQVGSIETGKDATFFISSGDALDIRSSNVEKAYIRGKEIDLDNKQKALYRKFKSKYDQK